MDDDDRTQVGSNSQSTSRRIFIGMVSSLRSATPLAWRTTTAFGVLLVTAGCSASAGAPSADASSDAGALSCRDRPTCQTQTHGTKCSFADWALPSQSPCGGYVGVTLSCFDSVEVMYYAADTGAFIARVEESAKVISPFCIEGPARFTPALSCVYPWIDDCRDAGGPVAGEDGGADAAAD